MGRTPRSWAMLCDEEKSEAADMFMYYIYSEINISIQQGVHSYNNNNNKSISIAPNQSRLLSGALQNIAN